MDGGNGSPDLFSGAMAVRFRESISTPTKPNPPMAPGVQLQHDHEDAQARQVLGCELPKKRETVTWLKNWEDRPQASKWLRSTPI